MIAEIRLGGLDAVDFLDVTLNFPGGHTARIHAHDLAVELRKTALILGDQQRIKGAVTVAWNVQDNLPAVGDHRLPAAPVAAVRGLVLALRHLVGALTVQMNVHLGAQRALCQRLGQLRKYARFAKQIAGRSAFHQPVQKVFVDAHAWVSSSGGLPRQSTKFSTVSLTAEQLVTVKSRRGLSKLEWQKLRERNEALDCRVYARAALHGLISMGMRLNEEVESVAGQVRA